MQLTLEFLEPPQPIPISPLWVSLDAAQRDKVVRMLARLLAKAAIARASKAASDEEARDE